MNEQSKYLRGFRKSDNLLDGLLVIALVGLSVAGILTNYQQFFMTFGALSFVHMAIKLVRGVQEPA